MPLVLNRHPSRARNVLVAAPQKLVRVGRQVLADRVERHHIDARRTDLCLLALGINCSPGRYGLSDSLRPAIRTLHIEDLLASTFRLTHLHLSSQLRSPTRFVSPRSLSVHKHEINHSPHFTVGESPPMP